MRKFDGECIESKKYLCYTVKYHQNRVIITFYELIQNAKCGEFQWEWTDVL